MVKRNSKISSKFAAFENSEAAVPAAFAKTALKDTKKLGTRKFTPKEKFIKPDVDISSKIAGKDSDLDGFGDVIQKVKKENGTIGRGAMNKFKMTKQLSLRLSESDVKDLQDDISNEVKKADDEDASIETTGKTVGKTLAEIRAAAHKKKMTEQAKQRGAAEKMSLAELRKKKLEEQKAKGGIAKPTGNPRKAKSVMTYGSGKKPEFVHSKLKSPLREARARPDAKAAPRRNKSADIFGLIDDALETGPTEDALKAAELRKAAKDAPILPSKPQPDVEEEKRKAEEEARIAKEKEEEEARIKAEQEALAAKEKAEQEARLAKEKEEEEARIAKQKEEEEAKVKAERDALAAKEKEEARIAEEAKKAEEKRRADEAKLAEEKRLADEAKLAEEKRLADEAKIAEEKRIAEDKAAAEAKLAEEKRLAEEARLKAEEEARIADEKRVADEASRKAEEEARIAEEKRVAEKAAAKKDETSKNITDSPTKKAMKLLSTSDDSDDSDSSDDTPRMSSRAAFSPRTKISSADDSDSDDSASSDDSDFVMPMPLFEKKVVVQTTNVSDDDDELTKDASPYKFELSVPPSAGPDLRQNLLRRESRIFNYGRGKRSADELREALKEVTAAVAESHATAEREMEAMKKDIATQKEKYRREVDKKIFETKKSNEKQAKKDQKAFDAEKKMIQDLRDENARWRGMRDKYPKQMKEVQASTESLEAANKEVEGHFESLNKFVKKLEADHEKLDTSVKVCRDEYLPRYRQELYERNQFADTETKIKNLYRNICYKISKAIEKSRGGSSFLSDVKEMIMETEAEVDPKFDARVLFNSDSDSSGSDSDSDSSSSSDSSDSSDSDSD